MHPVLFHIGWLLVPSYGAVTSIGVLMALALAQFTAKRVQVDSPALDPRHAWNMLVLAVFASLAVSRLLLIVANLSDLRAHPAWLLSIAMVHHPLLAAAGVAGAVIALVVYIRWARLDWRVVGDCLAAPVALGYALEQVGALLEGSDYGSYCEARWAVTYTSTLAVRWSGTPLDVPLHPVQAYAAVGALLVTAICLLWMRLRRRRGDVGGVWLIGMGVLFFVTEIFRDWEGRGAVFGGILDIPQLVGLGMVLLGGAVLVDWRAAIPATVVEENEGN